MILIFARRAVNAEWHTAGGFFIRVFMRNVKHQTAEMFRADPRGEKFRT